MADRTATVTLRGRVDQYVQAFKQASAGTTSFATGTEASLRRVGSAMQSFGRTATLGITTPLVGLAGASVAMASSFETAFGRMQGLAGVSADEIDGLQASVMELAGQTAQSPQQLAEALYFLRSSGLDAGEAMSALEVSAQASAAGLGDTAVIADAVSSAMNAYAASGLSAAEATDVLVATARAGKAEPAELAGALGRVLPIASELGITFQDVGGALAALSLTGNDASTSATLLQNIMSKLLKPSQQGAEALEDVGLSADAIRRSIEDQGLLATLEMLKSKLGDAGFVKFLEDAQAVQGALTLVGDESGTVAAAFDNVAGSAGATGEAFGAVADGDAFKMKQALVDVQTAMLVLGQTLLPIAADIAGGIARVAGVFTDLDPALQTVVIAIGALAAAGGPVLILAGSIVKNFNLLKTTLENVGPAATKAGLALGAIGLAATAAVLIYQSMGREQRELNARTHEVAGALGEQTGAAWDLAEAAEGATGAIDGLTLANAGLQGALMAGEGGDKIRESFGALGLDISDLLTWMDMLQGSDVVRGDAFYAMAAGAGVARENLNILAETIEQTDDNGAELQSLLALNLQNGLNISSEAAAKLAAELMPVASAMEELDDQSENFDGNAVTREFLLLAAGSNDLANKYITLAEEQTGLSRNGEHTRSIMAKLLEIIDGLPPVAEAAARAALGLDGAVAQSALAAQDAAEGMRELDAATSAIPGGLRAATAAAADAARGINDLNDVTSMIPGGTGPWFKDATDDLIDFAEELDKVDGRLGKLPGHLTDVKGFMDLFTSFASDAKGASDGLSDFAGMVDYAASRMLDASSIDYTGPWTTALSEAERVASTYGSALDSAFGNRGGSLRQVDELNGMYEDFADNLDDTSHSLAGNTAAGRTNRGVIFDMADGIKGLIQARIDEGWSLDAINTEYQANRQYLLEAAAAAGLSEEATNQLLNQYGLVPDLVRTTIDIAGEAFAQFQIQSIIDRLNELPEEQQAEIISIFNSQGADAAEAALNAIEDEDVYIKVHVTGLSGLNLGIHGHAAGAYIPSPEVALLHANELVLPLSNPARMGALLGMPQARPAVDAMANLMPAPNFFTMTAPAPQPVVQGGLTTGDIYVSDRRDIPRVVDALGKVNFLAEHVGG